MYGLKTNGEGDEKERRERESKVSTKRNKGETKAKRNGTKPATKEVKGHERRRGQVTVDLRHATTHAQQGKCPSTTRKPHDVDDDDVDGRVVVHVVCLMVVWG